ncbi:unnamed protein product [Lepeophtheirus salmonis]|uniref:(salmon louse) hypothetical protein n=1 Tax=Lepeophtheirus salmonis TaxID=72036 RepID=A0A7R8HF33_LEPSM|nr:unnamed protein product [Lepeophtheirus salmonis]CAF3037730.1 unnamed protein product [Lepeophtheirus salmonis]
MPPTMIRRCPEANTRGYPPSPDCDDGLHCCYMRVFEERFNVEHLSHSMNPEFFIRDGLMLPGSPSHPEGDALPIEGKARSGCEGYFGKGGVVQQGMIEGPCPKEGFIVGEIRVREAPRTSEGSPPSKQTGDVPASQSRTYTLLHEEIMGKSANSLTQHCSSVQTNTKSTIHEPRLSSAMTHNS